MSAAHVAPCSWRGRDLPDHGSFERTWSVDRTRGEAGFLKRPAPAGHFTFEIERAIELQKMRYGSIISEQPERGGGGLPVGDATHCEIARREPD